MASKSPATSPVKKPASSAAKKSPAGSAEKAPVKNAAKTSTPAPTKKTGAKPDGAPDQKSDDLPKKTKAIAQPKEKIKKPKLVRDSFTMPEAEYRVLGDVKKACIKAGFEVKKSELLRVGVALIRNLEPQALQKVLSTLPSLKAGRPKLEA
jgi:hypothetical protein